MLTPSVRFGPGLDLDSLVRSNLEPRDKQRSNRKTRGNRTPIPGGCRVVSTSNRILVAIYHRSDAVVLWPKFSQKRSFRSDTFATPSDEQRIRRKIVCTSWKDVGFRRRRVIPSEDFVFCFDRGSVFGPKPTKVLVLAPVALARPLEPKYVSVWARGFFGFGGYGFVSTRRFSASTP